MFSVVVQMLMQIKNLEAIHHEIKFSMLEFLLPHCDICINSITYTGRCVFCVFSSVSLHHKICLILLPVDCLL